MGQTNYKDSNINADILRGIEEMGFVEMTPIQEMTIPVLLEGKDIIGQAQTGTGKTAAFGIPMIEKIDPKDSGVQGIILCPTRELAIQAAEEIRKLAKYTQGVKVLAVYGGQDIDRQIRALKAKVSIVVGTPGRVMDHMRRRTLKLGNIKMLVLDEADEMLNMGFREDIETICQDLPVERQTALFSATMPKEILEITRQYQKNAKLLKVQQQELTIPLVKQSFYVVKGREKDASLCRLIDFMAPKKALIFCNTKKKVDELTLMLKGRGYYAEALHGDLSQHQRDRVMDLFRNGKLELLLATDVAARGIDVDDIEMVFNYDMPQDMEYYVHRIGRTGRAGKKGKAFSIVTGREIHKIRSLREFCNAEILEKQLPTAASVNSVKALKTLEDAIAFAKTEDMTEYMQLVYAKTSEDGINAIEIAAAFLRMNMGELLTETEPETESESSRRGGDRRDGRRRDGRSGGGRSRSGGGGRDGRRRDGGRSSGGSRSGGGSSRRSDSDRSRTRADSDRSPSRSDDKKPEYVKSDAKRSGSGKEKVRNKDGKGTKDAGKDSRHDDRGSRTWKK